VRPPIDGLDLPGSMSCIPLAESGAIAARWSVGGLAACHPRATSGGHERDAGVSHGHSDRVGSLGELGHLRRRALPAGRMPWPVIQPTPSPGPALAM
jgi:hypothetical protein